MAIADLFRGDSSAVREPLRHPALFASTYTLNAIFLLIKR